MWFPWIQSYCCVVPRDLVLLLYGCHMVQVLHSYCFVVSSPSGVWLSWFKPYPFCCVVSSDLYILHSHWRGITLLCFLLILHTVLLFYLIQSYCCEVPCGPVLQHCVVWFPVTKSYCCVVPWVIQSWCSVVSMDPVLLLCGFQWSSPSGVWLSWFRSYTPTVLWFLLTPGITYY